MGASDLLRVFAGNPSWRRLPFDFRRSQSARALLRKSVEAEKLPVVIHAHVKLTTSQRASLAISGAIEITVLWDNYSDPDCNIAEIGINLGHTSGLE